MTIVIGSVWKHKRSPFMRAVVVFTMKHRGEKFIIYEVSSPGLLPVMRIHTAREFTRLYEHPDTVGDVP